jgi:DNA-3-methyladenine glycosylase
MTRGETRVSPPLPRGFFERPVLEVASDLIGCAFLCDGVGGRLVEVEAYRSDDPASHSYRGRTARNAVMFGPAGHLYVYFTMGLHFCVNVVCGAEGEAAAVLLRALEPTAGLELMRARRGLDDPRRLCSGPAKLTRALGITRADDGASACEAGGRFGFFARDDGAGGGRDGGGAHLAGDRAAAARDAPRVLTTPRVGVAAGRDTPWRFVDAGSACLSRPLPRALRR